jgi:hypothetical protein
VGLSRRNSYNYQPLQLRTCYAGFIISYKMGNSQLLETVVYKDAASVHPSEMLSPTTRNLTAAAEPTSSKAALTTHCHSPRSLMPKGLFIGSWASGQTQSFYRQKI